MRLAAFSKSFMRSLCVESTVPLPGSAMPSTSLRQFIEFAVNMPEQEPQVGHARRSSSASFSSEYDSSAPLTMTSIRSYFSPSKSPASIGPPETKIAGIFRRIAAMSMPGVTLSQLEIQTMASTRCALHMYSTESAMRSRDGSEYNIPSCPMAMPSSMAMVLNSAAKQPCASMSAFICCPILCKCVCPGTNCVNELTMPIIGLPSCSSFMPLARQSARAPAMRRPSVLSELRNFIVGRDFTRVPAGTQSVCF